MRRPIFWVGIAFALGEVLIWHDAFWIIVLAPVLIIFSHTGSVQKKLSLGKGGAFALLAFLLLGAFKMHGAMEVWTYDHLVDDELQIDFAGQVAGLDVKKNSTYIYLERTTVKGLPGLTKQVDSPNMVCIVDGDRSQDLVTNDQIFGKGTIHHFETAGNLGQFDERSYYESQGYAYKIYTDSLSRQNNEHDPLYKGLSKVRSHLKRVYDSTLYDAGTINAMVLGEKADLRLETRELYNDGGISHILAISGLHISIIGMMVFGLLRKTGISTALAALLSTGVIFSYGLMVGFGVSSKRAVFMFLIALGAKVWGRTYDFLSALSLSLFLILWRQPMMLLNSGFLMSYFSVAGAGFLYPCILKILPDSRMVKHLGCGGCVFLTTLPLTAWFYFEVPVYGILLNLIVIPLMSIVVCSALVAGLIGGVFSGASTFFLGSVHYILEFYEFVCRIFNRLPWSQVVTGRPEMWQIILYYGILIFVVYVAYKNKRKRLLFMLAALMILFVRLPDGKLSITFMDVGQGDGIFIKLPEGKHLFMDGGSSSENQVGKYRIVPFLKYMGISSLDYVMITHGDSDHYSGMAEILSGDTLDIHSLILPEAGMGDEGMSRIIEIAGKRKTEVFLVESGDKICLGDVEIEFIHPDKDFVYEKSNEYSLTSVLKFMNFSAIFTGDLEGTGEDAVRENGCLKTCDVLKVAHHGSKNSTDDDFLQMVAPKISVISCGTKNTYGHPHQETLKRLWQAESDVYCTAEHGAVTIYTDGEKIEVETMNSVNR